MVRDPVCGMQLDEESSVESSEYQGKTYYFCSPDCKAAFDQDQQKYLAEDDES
ncbi:YHS domain-containing protein [Caldithrix abyssi]